MHDPTSPKVTPRAGELEPEQIYPTSPKPVEKKERFKLRDLEPLLRRRVRDWREAKLGASGRIRARYDGEFRRDGEKIAIYSHFSTTGRVSAMVRSQVSAYAAEGFDVVFVSMCESLADSDLSLLRELCSAVVVRRSFGRDFGAWRDILTTDLVRRDQIRELLLVNDSVLGPIRPLEPVFARVRSTDGLWGLVNSDQNGSHLQTFFLLCRGRPAVQTALSFFDNLVLSTDKETVINNAELSFSPSLARRGISVRSLYSLRKVEDAALEDRKSRLETILSLGRAEIYEYFARNPDASPEDLNVLIRNVMAGAPVNPSHQFGEVLVRKFGFPFIKTELLVMNPTNMSICSTWRSLITDESPCSVDVIVDHLCLL